MLLEMTRREAEREAWEAGEHRCQTQGHSFPMSGDTNEPLPCSVCGADPYADEDADA